MISCRPMRDRRGLDRSSNGDRKSCPKCQASFIEFSERYRLPEAEGPTVAWVCDSPSCGHVEPVREVDKRRWAEVKRRMVSMHLKQVRSKKSG